MPHPEVPRKARPRRTHDILPALRHSCPASKLVRELVEKIIVDEKTIIIKLRRGLLLGEDVASSASEAASDSAVELTATASLTRRGAETKLVLPGLAQQALTARILPRSRHMGSSDGWRNWRLPSGRRLI